MTASFPGGGWALRDLRPRAGVGSPLGRDQGRGGGCHSELSPGRETRCLRCRLPLPPRARSSPRAPAAPRTSAASCSAPRCTGTRSGSSRPGPWRAERASAGPSGGAREDAVRGGPRAEQGPRASPERSRPWKPQPPPRPRET